MEGVEKKDLVQLIKVAIALIWCTIVDVNKCFKKKRMNNIKWM